jgi:hypothetical protein
MMISNGVKKIITIILFVLIFFSLIFAGYLFIGRPPQAKEITWGVNFSQKHAQNLGLNWQETYLALLNDLEVKNIKLATYWDLIEGEKGEYNFEDLDWQIKKAEEKGVKLLLVIGMKTPRWPECHIPIWAKDLSKEEQQERILDLIEEIVLKYRNSSAISMWQIENEPFFPFGECSWVDKDFFKKEINLVKSLDSQKRPIVISDSGEGSFWVVAAKLGDVVGTTMYKKVWFSFSWEKEKIPFFPQKIGFYVSYPFPPTFYWRKAQLIEKIFDKKVIVVELQAEPWGPRLLYDSPLSEQEKTMNLKQFQKNLEFAKKTGFNEFYFWGAEWWCWMRETQNKPEIWEEAKNLFKIEH